MRQALRFLIALAAPAADAASTAARAKAVAAAARGPALALVKSPLLQV